jgi:hypothetical protein
MNRRYLIINTDELDRVDFNVVAETSVNTVRKSIDQTKTFIKWNYLGISTEGVGIGTSTIYSEILPSFVSGVGLSSERVAISTYQGPYSHSEILTILATDVWTSTEEL